jgi:hypothetical protein
MTTAPTLPRIEGLFSLVGRVALVAGRVAAAKSVLCGPVGVEGMEATR